MHGAEPAAGTASARGGESVRGDEARDWAMGLGLESLVLDALLKGKDEDQDTMHYLSTLTQVAVGALLGGAGGTAHPFHAAVFKTVANGVARLAAIAAPACTEASVSSRASSGAGPPPSLPPPFPSLECAFADADAEREAPGKFGEAMAACAAQATLTPNARQAETFSTELFEGSALMLVRPERREDDQHYAARLFDGRSRCLEVAPVCDTTRV